MFQDSILSVLCIALFSIVASATCPANRPVELCCQDLSPFSDNAVVLIEVCGLDVLDQSIITGTNCQFPLADGCDSLHGEIDACCVDEQVCVRAFNDSPVGFNCTGTPIP